MVQDKARRSMKTTTIGIRVDADMFFVNEERCVNYILEDENGISLLQEYLLEELEALDDERLESIMLGLDCVRSLFERIIENRNKRNRQIALELEEALGEPVETRGLTRYMPSRETKRREREVQ